LVDAILVPKKVEGLRGRWLVLRAERISRQLALNGVSYHSF